MLAATYALIDISRSTGFDSYLLPAIEDHQSEEFNDWFRDAAIIVTPLSRFESSVMEDVSKKTTKMVDDSEKISDDMDHEAVA